MDLVKKINKETIAMLLMTFILLISPITVGLIKTEFSVGGAARFYLIELIVLSIGIYAVGWQLIIKRKYKQLSPVSKVMFSTAIVFGIYYSLTIIVRLLTHNLTFGSFFLARVVIESVVVFLCLDYFSISRKTIFRTVLLTLALVTLWQYGILILGGGFLRGKNPVLTISYVYVIFCNVAHVILLKELIGTENKKIKAGLLLLFFFNMMTILLTGSRVGIVISLFTLTLFVLFKKGMEIKTRCLNIVLIYGLTLVGFVLMFTFSNNVNKGIIVRSISVPLKVIDKVTPEAVSDKIESLLIFEIDNDKIQDISSEEDYKDSSAYVDDTIEVSGNQRKEANQKAYDLIFSDAKSLLFGRGTNIIHRYGDVYQKPHNYFAQFTLAFGIVGLVMVSIILFAPIFFLLKRKGDLFFLLLLLFSFMFNAFLQPSFGNIVVLYVYMTVLFSMTVAREDNEDKEF